MHQNSATHLVTLIGVRAPKVSQITEEIISVMTQKHLQPFILACMSTFDLTVKVVKVYVSQHFRQIPWQFKTSTIGITEFTKISLKQFVYGEITIFRQSFTGSKKVIILGKHLKQITKHLNISLLVYSQYYLFTANDIDYHLIVSVS